MVPSHRAVFVLPAQVYDEDSYTQYLPLLLHSVVPLVAGTLYTFLAKALNKFEEHSTPVKRKNALVIKVRACCRFLLLLLLFVVKARSIQF